MTIEFIRLTDKYLEEPLYVRVDMIECIMPASDTKITAVGEKPRAGKLFSSVKTSCGDLEVEETPSEIRGLIVAANSELDYRIRIIDSYELFD